MTNTKLNYRFHNPNTPEASAEHLLQILIDANRSKVEENIKQATQKEDKHFKNYEES